ncbi:DUF4381 domain-containing protein [Salegentibacter chungangensis]|uniref:DUF4381 domain-containing protein n=1 Tax=Salegentibacter chungangensis TaxID=1335724 RepID=A0ABW3NLR9_9FLAO
MKQINPKIAIHIIRKTSKTKALNAALAFLISFFSIQTSAQQANVAASIDSAQIKIGEQIKYSVQVETDSANLVVFPENSFTPMEVVESFKPDTTRVQDKFRLLKEYSLTKFDSGKYVIPQQRILVAGKEFLTDSMLVEVATVVVDTTRQKMYPIKASVDIPPKFGIPLWVWYLLAALLILGLVLFFIYRRKKKAETKKELPPYEQAMQELAKLDNSPLLQQREIKEYYSQLTSSVRRYLDRKVYDRALESTTSELIDYLELNREAGKIKLDQGTIDNLKKILQRADLAKFANSRPDVITAKEDRSKVEHIINDVKASTPEPSEEELLKDEEYRKERLQRRRQRRVIAGAVGGVLILVIAVSILAATKGFTYVKDTFLGHPTKELLEGEWIRSEYGTPPVTITTPEVLKRGELPLSESAKKAMLGRETFMYGSLISNFYTVLNTVKFGNQQQDFDLEKAVDGIYEYLEKQGARNIIMKQEDFTTVNGAKGIKVFGTLEIENPVTKRPVQNEYMILNFAENGGFEQITVIYDVGDVYAEEIAGRIINSVELKNIEN